MQVCDNKQCVQRDVHRRKTPLQCDAFSQRSALLLWKSTAIAGHDASITLLRLGCRDVAKLVFLPVLF